MPALDKIFGEGATAEYEAAANSIFPCDFEYAQIAEDTVRVYLRWHDGNNSVGFCKVELSPDLVAYLKLEFEPEYRGAGGLSAMIVYFYPWYLKYRLKYIRGGLTNPESIAQFKHVGCVIEDAQDGPHKIFVHEVSADSRFAEYSEWKIGLAPEPEWHKGLV